LSSEQKALEGFDKNESEEETDWERKKLSEVAEINPGSINDNSFNLDEIKYLDISSVGKGFIEELTDYSLEDAPSRAKRTVKEGDAVLSRVRPVREQFTLLRSPPDNLVVSTGFAVLRANKGIDEKFLYYAFTSPEMIRWMDNHTSGSAYPAVNLSTLKHAEILVPPLKIQKKIGRILHNIDEKIETNKRINEILEEMAHALFKSWFVEYESYEDFKDSELGEIPEDFEVKNLVDIADVIYGYSFSSDKFNEEGEGMPVIRIRNLPDNETDKYSPEEFKDKYRIEAGDVLAGMDGEFRPHIWKGPEAGLNQRVCKFEGKEPLYSEIYLWNVVRKPLYKLEKSKTGTTVVHLGKKDIDQIKIAVPDEDSLRRFNEILRPFYQEMINRKQENRKLEDMRDTLLPKLMSGEIRVNVDGDE